MAKILIIDDDYLMNEALSNVVGLAGHEAYNAYTLKEGLDTLSGGDIDAVFLDVRMPDGNGLEALSRIRRSPSEPEVIIITGMADPQGAELAIRNGAWDYIKKPSSIEEMTLPLIRALEYREKKKAARPPLILKRDDLIGKSQKINAALEQLAIASISEANVIITGETGTGKELFAHAIHRNSPRASENFVVVDCAALPHTLVESILFGHEKGAFTGADREKQGLIYQARGGTLFLDEVGELPLSVQKSFLRVLHERRYRRVGSHEETAVDFRLIAATNRDLGAMAQTGAFRDDLLFRLRGITIELPPLKERKEDIREITFHYTHKLCDLYGMEPKGFSSDFLDVLIAYDWPGNIRELIHTLEYALSNARNEPTLFAYHLPAYLRVNVIQSALEPQKPVDASVLSPSFSTTPSESMPTLKEMQNQMELEYLRKLLHVSKGKRKDACAISGLSRTRLYELLKKHRLSDG